MTPVTVTIADARIMSGLSAASVVIGGDADAPGRIAAERAAAAFVANGREVRVIYPSGAAKDFNAELVGAVR